MTDCAGSYIWRREGAKKTWRQGGREAGRAGGREGRKESEGWMVGQMEGSG